MAKPKVFVTRIVPETGFQMVQDFCDVDLWTDELPPSRETMLARVQGIDGLLCLLTDLVDAELLEAAGPQLKVVSNHAVGFDNIVVPDCTGVAFRVQMPRHSHRCDGGLRLGAAHGCRAPHR